MGYETAMYEQIERLLTETCEEWNKAVEEMAAEKLAKED